MFPVTHLRSSRQCGWPTKECMRSKPGPKAGGKRRLWPCFRLAAVLLHLELRIMRRRVASYTEREVICSAYESSRFEVEDVTSTQVANEPEVLVRIGVACILRVI